MLAGQASKLAGALSWVSSAMFHRLGRAMLRPLFDEKSDRFGTVGKNLRFCLQWWQEVFKLDLSQTKPWNEPQGQPVHLYVDARSTPPRLAAVLSVDGRLLYTDWEPPRQLMALFRQRGDNQIMSLELLAIALGLSTFADECRGRRVGGLLRQRGGGYCSQQGHRTRVGLRS